MKLGIYAILRQNDAQNVREFGVPFVALNLDEAKKLLLDTFGSLKCTIDVTDYSLVHLGEYDILAENPITCVEQTIFRVGPICKGRYDVCLLF